jgi:UDP-3-O-[3-hydroxymyristoyl] N-acetylglucosamine deacetylase
MELKGKTLRNSITFEGVGIHTGEISKIVIHPSERKGIFFILEGEKIPALHPYVVNTTLGTDLGKDGKVIRTVEHLMATFYLLKIDSAVVEVQKGVEIPILDGGAKTFVEEFLNTGFETLNHYQEILEVKAYRRIQPNGIFAEIYPAEEGIFEFEGEFQGLGRVKVSYNESEGVKEALIGARTFCYEDDIPKIRAANYGKGGYLVNTLIIDSTFENLVYSSEPAYHKLLDLIGDMALVGKRIKGRIYSFKGGHRLNHYVREYLLKLSDEEFFKD